MKLHLQKVFVLALSTAVFSLTGCGGGGSDSGSATTGTNQISDADRYFHSGKPGDVFQYSNAITYTNISGQPDSTTTLTSKQTFSQVQTIPAKYGYTGSLLPYLYCESTTDGTVDGKTYMTIG